MKRNSANPLKRTLPQKSVTDLNRILIESCPDPLFIIGPDGKITGLNKAAENVTGKNRVELIDSDFSCHFTEQGKATGLYKQVFANGFIEDFELELRHMDGSLTPLTLNGSVFINQHGNVEGMLASARKIISSKKDERLRHKAIERNSLLMDLHSKAHDLNEKEQLEQISVIAAKVTDSQIGFILEVSDNPQGMFMAAFNKEAGSFINESTGSLYPNDNSVLLDDLLRLKTPVIKNDYSISDNSSGIPAGRVQIKNTLTFPILENEKVRLVLTVGNNYSQYSETDINLLQPIAKELHTVLEMRKIDSDIQKILNRWKFAVEGSNEGIWDWNLLTDEVYYSDSWKKMIGFEPDEINQELEEWSKRVHPDDLPSVMEAINIHLKGESPDYISEHRVKCKNGTWKWIMDRGKVLEFTPDGLPSRMVGTHTDITDSKNAEEEIRSLNNYLEQKVIERTADLLAMHAELENFFNVALDLLSIVDSSGIFVRVNKAWENTLGYPLSEIENRSFLDFVHRDDIQKTLEAFAMLIDQKPIENFTNRYKTKDGNYRYIEWRSTAVGELIYSAARDVTWRIEAEQETRKINERLKLATRAGGVGIWEIDLEKNTPEWDDQMYVLYGIEKQYDLLEQKPWQTRLHPDDIERVTREFQQAIREVKEFNTEFRILWPDQSVHFLRGTAVFQHDSSGRPIRIIGTKWDITRQKDNEQELIRARNEAEMASQSKSDFLSRMSHELRTPLNSVLGFAQLLNMGALSPLQKKGVDRILQGGNRLLELINDVLDITRIDTGKLLFSMDRVKIKDIFADIADNILPLANNRDVSLKVEGSPNAEVYIKADRKRLVQVLNSLMSNAVKFNKRGGSVLVSTLLVNNEDGTGMVRISVEDTGIGIQEKDFEKLFMPFETIMPSQPNAAGTGLGLAVVKKLVEAMDGKVGVESTPGLGSTFWIELHQA